MTKFAYFRDFVSSPAMDGTYVALKGGYTAAYEEKDGVVNFVVAKCNEHENFNKKIGRQVAEGRLKAGKQVQTVVLAKDQSAYEAIMEAL